MEALYGDRSAPDDDAPPDPGAVTARVFAYSPEAPEPGGDDDAGDTPPVDLETSPSFLNVQLGDLAVLDVPSGRATRIAEWVRAIGYRLSPDGTRVAYTTRQPDGGAGALVYDRYDLWVAPADGSAPPRLLAPATVAEYGQGFSWSPNGRALAYHDGERVRVARADDGASIRAFGRDGVSLQHDYRPPLWLDDGTLVALTRDTLWRLSLAAPDSLTALAEGDGWRLLEIIAGSSAQRLDGGATLVAVSEPRTKRVGFRRIGLAGGGSSTLWTADMALGATDLTYHLDASADGKTVAFVAESGARPPDVWVSDAGFRNPRRLTDLHPAITGRALGESRLVEWTGPSGDTIQGALLLPAGYQSGTRYPLVVKVYGGSRLSYRLNRFGLDSGIDNLQLLATRGYAVLLPDAPTRPGSPMADIAAAVEGGALSVAQLGVADPDRMAVFGHSYGGYSALGTAVLSDAFRAVIASGGISNLLTRYRMLRPDGSAIGVSWSERGQGRMGGHPWSHPERYRDNSPFFHLDRVTAPVLLLHGGADPTALPAESEAVFVGLRRLGKPVTLVVYEGENHHPGSWSAANAEDYWRRIFGWLEKHLWDHNE